MNTPDLKFVLCVAWFVGLPAFPLDAADLGPRNATMWLYEEWSLENPSWEGNPFDLVARVTFSHAGSDQTRTTEMFYAGDGTWRFRFTGTRLGEWHFATTSDDPELNGLSGTITVRPNSDPRIKGFLTHKGNRFAIQTGDDAHLEAYRFNVYMNRTQFTGTIIGLPDQADDFQAYLDDARQHGFDTVFVHVVNNWFRYGALKYSEHDSDGPDSKTFEALEAAITTAHRQGCRVHFWAWGDESRKWTPIGVGGINGSADRRLQRTIAARLGPLPGWSMGYGFDLHEWTKGAQLDEWSDYLHKHMGWDHLLCTRGHRLPDRANNMNSYDGFGRGVELTTTSHGPKDDQEIVEDLNTDLDHPHFYEERHSYLRDGFQLDMDGTRRLLWWQTLAGGMGGFYGFYPTSPHPYPSPEQMRCVRDFWRGRFLLDMVRANELTNGLCLKTPDNTKYVFYRENTDTIRVDLSAATAPLTAVAVDTTKEYFEIDLGSLRPAKQAIQLPATSDWAIAVGKFRRQAPYPPSPIITGIEWAPGSTIVRKAKGGDNWPVTWGDDDRLYTAYGDGHGFEPFVQNKLSMGLARVTGGPEDFCGVNLRSPSAEREGGGASGAKVSGMLMVDGVLYMLVRNTGNSQLAWSSDHGRTWTWSPWKFTTSFGYPSFLNFGRNYEGSRDEYVYVYSHDSDSAYERADRMVFARVPAKQITDRDAYEFFQKLDADGAPVWTRDVDGRGAVFAHRGQCYRSSVSYNAPLRRYLWCQTGAGDDTRFRGGFGIYDAPEPWGPWTTVFFTPQWDVGPGETSCLPTKWISRDGRTVHLVFSGNDSFSVRKATLRLERLDKQETKKPR